MSDKDKKSKKDKSTPIQTRGHYFGPDSIGGVYGDLKTLKDGVDSSDTVVAPVGYWPFHLFKTASRASPEYGFIMIYAQKDGDHVDNALMVIYEGAKGPIGQPTHCIPLILRGDKQWTMGKLSNKTSKDQVRLYARDPDGKGTTPCFGVGRKHLNEFAHLLKPYVRVITKDRKKQLGVALETFDDPSLQ
mmetsp:Transcript_24697/g.27480  ORF Transcript_24697/g.27480 Transcript_24697/m.27480 type:complete len:189 (-) Transcript_24697:140-706(-)